MSDRRGGLLVLGIVAFVTLVSASGAQLNPLVVRTDARGPVPVECEQGLSATPALRVDLRDVPLPEPETGEIAAPPSSDLRSALRQTQNALARNDRPAFDAGLARAKALLANYPPGGEARAAQEVVRVHEAAARLWDAQYQSPFFSETSSEYAVASAYPDYAEAVRRATITDDAGARFYPAAESRDFLGRIAAERLKSLGIRSTTRIARAERPRRTPSVRSTPRVPKPKRSVVPRPRKPAAVHSSPSSPNPSATPTAAAGVVSAPPPPAAPAATATTTVATETAPLTDTIVPTTTTAATSTEPAPPAQPASRSILLPTILILIGLGVLIVLFRASK